MININEDVKIIDPKTKELLLSRYKPYVSSQEEAVIYFRFYLGFKSEYFLFIYRPLNITFLINVKSGDLDLEEKVFKFLKDFGRAHNFKSISEYGRVSNPTSNLKGDMAIIDDFIKKARRFSISLSGKSVTGRKDI